MNLTGNNGIVNDLVELALKVPRMADPPPCENAVYVFLRNLGDVVRAVLTSERDRRTSLTQGSANASGTHGGAHGAKGGK